jgi:hypothetical protein
MSIFLHRAGVMQFPQPAGVFTPFVLTAGADSGFVGYSDGTLLPAFGSISVQPISGETMTALASSGGAGAVYFIGDIVSLLSGNTVWVDDVEYPFDSFDWTFSGGLTGAEWSAEAPTFVDTVQYDVEIKAAS